nr:SMP-30/gluconolactonase/LRE family protein [Sphingomonas sp. CDS-1]
MTAAFSPAEHLAIGRSDFTVFDDRRCLVGECPLWDAAAERLFWVDVRGQRILSRKIDGSAPDCWQFDQPVASIALASDGCLIACLGTEIVMLDSQGRRMASIASIDADKPGFRLNECRVDRQGRLWAGTLHAQNWLPDGSLYQLADDGCWERRTGRLSVPNGLAWSTDGTRMYLTDTPTRVIDMFDCDPSNGAVSRRRPFAAMTEGMCDGATVDSDDHLWCAVPGGWNISRFAPDGLPERRIRLPIRFLTSCAFGGPEMNILFVTSATRPLSDAELEQQPASGCVIAIETDVRGIEEPRFRPATGHEAFVRASIG